MRGIKNNRERLRSSLLSKARPRPRGGEHFERLENRTLLSGNVVQVTSTLDETAGGLAEPSSLRAAINAANTTPGTTIDFVGFTAGTTITLTADLPAITGAGTVIDGTTAPGGRVTIDGGNNNVLDVQSTGFVVKGLAIADSRTAIELESAGSDASIINDYIGSVGTTLGINTTGILVDGGSTGDTIGGSTAADLNIISGNDTGISLGGSTNSSGAANSSNNLIQGNWIGLDTTGNAAVANSTTGISINSNASGNTITANVIAGTTYAAIYTNGDFGNTITGNLIGVNATNTATVSTYTDTDYTNGVVRLGGGSSTVAGDTFTNNTITGANAGQYYFDPAVYIPGSKNTLTGNTISSTYGSGISIDGSSNTIAHNVIDNSSNNGLGIGNSAENNTLSQNALYGNTNLGISLGNTENGVPLANQANGGTAASGPNGDQQYPTLTVADSGDGTNLTVGITLKSNPNTTYTIELYANAPSEVDASGYGEGQTYISSVTVTTDVNGNGTATANISKASFDGDYITATATNAGAYDVNFNPDAGATSEFAQNVAAPGVTVPTVSIANASAQPGNDVNFIVTLSSALAGAVTATYTLTPGTATTADFDASGGTVTIAAGTTQQTISIATYGDTSGANETFTIALSGLSTNALFSNSQATESATGSILANATGTVASSVAVGASSSSIAAGGSVTFTATVTGGSGTPTGSVTFLENGQSIGTQALNGNGIATLSTTSLDSGSNSITANYSGDGTYAVSTSSAITVNVGNVGPVTAASGTSLVESASSVIVGNSFTLTATVTSTSGSGATPTGTVTFFEDGNSLGNYTVASNGQAVATITASTATAGTTFSAVYSGDPNYSTSTSNDVSATFVPGSKAVPVVPKPVVPPSALTAGKFAAHIPVTVTNTGTATLKGVFSVQLYADTSATGLDGNQILLKSTNVHSTLKPGKKFSVNLATTKLPTNLVNGTYHLVAEITDPTGATNLAVTSQTVTVADPFVALTLTGDTVKPDTFNVKKSAVTETILVTNTGNVNATGLLNLYASPFNDSYAAGDLGDSSGFLHVNIKPGKSQKVVIHGKYNGAGTFPVGVFSESLYATLNGVSASADVAGAFTVL